MFSYDIKKALAYRHRQDLFFTEVKSGASGAENARIDALAIRPSYTRYLITGYEIKVSISDFRGDHKWMSYLSMCNELYFCLSEDVKYDLSDIPEQCGLMVYKPDNKIKFKIVKKAPYRIIDPPEGMYKYLLFKYIGEYQYSKKDAVDDLLRSSKLEKYRDYLDNKLESREIGALVSQKIASDLSALRYKNESLRRRIEEEDSEDKYLLDLCKILGIDDRRFMHRYQYRSAIIDAVRVLSKTNMDANIYNSIKQINQITSDMIKSIDNEGGRLI